MGDSLKHWGVLGMHWGITTKSTPKMVSVRGKPVQKMVSVHGKLVPAVSTRTHLTLTGTSADKQFQADLLKLHQSGKGNDEAEVIKVAAKYDKAKALEKSIATYKKAMAAAEKIKNTKLSELPKSQTNKGLTTSTKVVLGGLGSLLVAGTAFQLATLAYQFATLAKLRA